MDWWECQNCHVWWYAGVKKRCWFCRSRRAQRSPTTPMGSLARELREAAA